MKPQIIVASHRRSGTHLTIDAICQNFAQYKNSIPASEAFLEQFRGKGNEKLIRAKEAVKSKSNVFFTHIHDINTIQNYFQDDPDLLAFTKDLFNNSKVIYIQRDGRDVMVSMYEWMKTTNVSPSDISFSEFIKEPNNWSAPAVDGNYNRIEFWNHHRDNWRRETHVLQMQFEDFLLDFDKCIFLISKHCDLKLPTKIINSKRKPFLGFIPYGKWTRRIHKYCISPFAKNSQSHYFRKGASGDHIDYFSLEDISYYQEQLDKYNHNISRT